MTASLRLPWMYAKSAGMQGRQRRRRRSVMWPLLSKLAPSLSTNSTPGTISLSLATTSCSAAGFTVSCTWMPWP